MTKKDKTFEKIKDLISKKEPQSNNAAKKLAMRNNIKLGKLRREFCQKCYFPLEKAKKRIKRGHINFECGVCRENGRWKV